MEPIKSARGRMRFMAGMTGHGGGPIRIALLTGCTLIAAVSCQVSYAAAKFRSGDKEITFEEYVPVDRPAKAGVVLLHGAGGPRSSNVAYVDLAQSLAVCGYVVVVPHYFDAERASGADTAGNYRIWVQVVKDALAYLASRRQIEPQRIAIVGYSLGASIALAAASRGRVGAVVSWSGSLPDEYFHRLETLPPTLLIHGCKDTVIPTKNSSQLADLCNVRHFSCELKLYPSETHVFRPAAVADVTRDIESFLERTIGESPQTAAGPKSEHQDRGSQARGEADPNALLTRAIETIRRNASNLPRFTCGLTLNRSMYIAPQSGVPYMRPPENALEAGSGRRLAWTDHLHLEIAVSEGREMFSWPGAASFESGSLEDMAPGGATGSGEFGPFQIGVFLADADPLSFRYAGTTSLSGYRVAEYHYRVPVETSHYLIRTELGFDPTGYEGSFWIDLQSSDLRRLSVEVNHPPDGSHVTGARVLIDYQRQQIGSANALLPTSSALRMALESGGLAVNRNEYGNCRQFEAESTVSFESTPSASAVGEPDREPSLAELPAGLIFDTALTTPIDTRTTFTGDAIEAKVIRQIKEGTRLVIPAGARMRGRVLRLEQHLYPEPCVVLGIRFDRLELNGVWVPVRLVRHRAKEEMSLMPGEHRPDVTTSVSFGRTNLRLAKGTVLNWETR